MNIGLLADELIYYRCTEYDTGVDSILAQARASVEQRAPQVTNAASFSILMKHRFPIGRRFTTTSLPTGLLPAWLTPA